MNQSFRKFIATTFSGLLLGVFLSNAKADVITFYFEGPVSSVFVVDGSLVSGLGNFVTGSVTFDTSTVPTPFGEGSDRAVYYGAVTSFSFSTNGVYGISRAYNCRYAHGQQWAQTWLGTKDALYFYCERFLSSVLSTVSTHIQISTFGQDMLPSLDLPTEPPNGERVDFFWYEHHEGAEEFSYEISSNDIRWVYPSIPPFSVEAESMALSGGYSLEENVAASGGQLIRRLDSGGQPATASTQYTGPAGNYDIAVSYFDESDGRSSLAFFLNGQPLDQWMADENPACRDCASPGESTLRSRVVARDIRLSPGDKITLQGTGDYYEYARFDKITVAPVISTTLEAEMMTLEGGYAVEANAAASGGQLIRRLDSGGYAATASTEFAGLAGAYDITVSYFDEYDGMSSLAFLLNGEMLDQWIADEDPLCRDCASPGASTLRTRLVAKELRLVPGDVIALQGTGEHYEYARFDKITLAPVGFTTLEAEMMTLDESFVVEANAAASGGQLIRGNGPADSVTGNASAAFMGSQGTYDITVTYFDEYDGINSMAFFLNGQLLDRWLADENPACRDCASPNERTLRSRVVATGIELSPGDDVRLESTVNQYEYGRFDKIDFTPSLSH
jgi:hypothetical protein